MRKKQKVVMYIKLIYGVNVCIYYIRSLNVHFWKKYLTDWDIIEVKSDGYK